MKKIGMNSRRINLKTLIPNITYIIFAIVFIDLALRPLLTSGFYADDMSNSLSWTALTKGGPSRFDMVSKGSPDGPVPGRFYPLSNYAYFLFDFIHGDAWLYKAIILVAIIGNLLLFSYFLKRITDNKAIALLSLIIVPCFFQFRIFYDPITSFHAFMQIVMMLTLLSLIALDYFLETKKPIYFILSITIYTISLYLYEITYIFFILHMVLLYFRTKKIKLTMGFIAPFIISVGIASWFSFQARRAYASMPSYHVHFQFDAYFSTLFREMYAAFPLSYFTSNPGGMFDHGFSKILSKVTFLDLLTVSLFFILYLRVLNQSEIGFGKKAKSKMRVVRRVKRSQALRNRRIEQESQELRKGHLSKQAIILVSFGVLLLILPGGMIALSPIYQYLIYWGISHIPVYLSYYGAFLILSGIILYGARFLGSKSKTVASYVLGMFIVLIFLVNFQNNRQVVETQNQTYWYKRNTLEVLEKRLGLFDGVASNSLLLMDSTDNLSLDVQPFIYSITHRHIPNFDTRRLIPWYQSVKTGKSVSSLTKADPNSYNSFGLTEKSLFTKYHGVYIFKYWSDSADRGFSVIARISDLKFDSQNRAEFVKSDSLELFMLGKPGIGTRLIFTYYSKPTIDGVVAKKNNVIMLPATVDAKQIDGTQKYVIPLNLQDGGPNAWIDFNSINLNSFGTSN